MVQYKDKKVFGVPLLLNVSQSGCAVPQAILDAMRYLKKNGEYNYYIYKTWSLNPDVHLIYQASLQKEYFAKQLTVHEYQC